MLAVDWQNLQVATAFVLGAALGTLATIRVMRAVLQTYERYRPTYTDRGAKEPPPSEDDGGS